MIRPAPSQDFHEAMIVSLEARDGMPRSLEYEPEYKFTRQEIECISEYEKGAYITLFCCTPIGNSVALVVPVKPWFRIEIPEYWLMQTEWKYGLQEYIKTKFKKDIDIDTRVLSRFYGFIAGDNNTRKKYHYATVYCNEFKDCRDISAYLSTNTIQLPYLAPVKVNVVDSLQKAGTKFFNDTGIIPSSWITVKNIDWQDTTYSRFSNCQLEGIVQLEDIQPLDKQSIAPLVIVSFDAEMYSHSGLFPDSLKGDFTTCIGISVYQYGLKTLKKLVLNLGEAIVDPSIDIRCYKDSKSLMEGFREAIVQIDPDIITGWNIYGFDFPFMHEEYSSYFETLRGLESHHHPKKTISQLLSAKKKHEISSFLDSQKKIPKYILNKIYKQIDFTGGMDHDSDSDDSDDEIPEKYARPLRSSLGCHDLKEIKEKAEGVQRLFDLPFYDEVMYGLYLGRFAAQQCTLESKYMRSSARGDNLYRYWNMSGRIQIDLMQVIKDDKKPESCSLKYAAQLWLKDMNKIELDVGDIFAFYKSGDPIKKGKVAEYCIRDCDIPIHLIEALGYIPTWIEMSRVCFTPLHDVINSGQQIKVFNLISRFVHGKYVINQRDSGWPSIANEAENNYEDFKKGKAEYQGATVIEPIPGFYTDPVSTLDFEGLYPSIIRFFNLCPSTLLLDDIGTIPHESHEINHGEYVKSYKFATHEEGVLPQLLKHLKTCRDEAKLAMKNADNEDVKTIQNARQNGIKLCMNSVYGFCGVSVDKGMLSCRPLAAVTTLKGRGFIESAKQYVESKYENSKVIYGDTDSIMIRWPSGTTIQQAFDLGEKAADEVTTLLRSQQGERGKDIQSNSAVRLTNEKVYDGYLLFLKKNYAGIKCLPSKNGFSRSMDFKGIDPVRRDRSKLVREVCTDVLVCLLEQRSTEAAQQKLLEALDSITKRPMEDFVLSKSIKTSYTSNAPHNLARERMIARGDADIPPVGSRMPFIIVAEKVGVNKKNTSKIYSRSDHPTHVKKNNLQIDYAYYMESLQNPMLKLLQFTDVNVKSMFSQALGKAEVERKGFKSLLTQTNEKKQRCIEF